MNSSLKVDPATAFRTAIALADAGIELKTAQLMRELPDASEAEILERVNLWLRARPLDGPGRLVLR